MMKWGRRGVLFVLTNLLVVFTINIVLSLLGVQPYLAQWGINYGSLMTFCVIWGFGGAFISLAISRMTAKWFMGVKVIDPDNPGSSSERWLVDTVFRLAKNAGLETMPEVGIYDSPDANAFATGPTRDHALVAVSSGLFQRMGKDEIEGVLGHETTHVANGDMVTMTLLQGIINAFVMFLSRIIAFALAQGRRDEGRGGSFMMQYMLVMVLQMAFGILGMIPLMAFSRWREFRADTGGAKLAGRAKMINALKALEGLKPLPPDNEPASVQALKIFGNGGHLFASHPPLEERIVRLQTEELSSVVTE